MYNQFHDWVVIYLNGLEGRPSGGFDGREFKSTTTGSKSATSEQIPKKKGALNIGACSSAGGGGFRPAGRRFSLTQAVQALQAAFTGPIATGLALVAIVVGGLMFAFGEGAARSAP